MLTKTEMQYLINALEKTNIMGRDALGVLNIFKKLDSMIPNAPESDTPVEEKKPKKIKG